MRQQVIESPEAVVTLCGGNGLVQPPGDLAAERNARNARGHDHRANDHPGPLTEPAARRPRSHRSEQPENPVHTGKRAPRPSWPNAPGAWARRPSGRGHRRAREARRQTRRTRDRPGKRPRARAGSAAAPLPGRSATRGRRRLPGRRRRGLAAAPGQRPARSHATSGARPKTALARLEDASLRGVVRRWPKGLTRHRLARNRGVTGTSVVSLHRHRPSLHRGGRVCRGELSRCVTAIILGDEFCEPGQKPELRSTTSRPWRNLSESRVLEFAAASLRTSTRGRMLAGGHYGHR